jgi:mannose-6-phosphate isomerase-like protein (cupin superfamily)
MQTVDDFIKSGILELYVLGHTADHENAEVKRMCSAHPEVMEELERITESVISISSENTFTPNDTVKPLIMATVDYTERLRLGEVPGNPPILNSASKIDDYAEWLSRPDMVLASDADNIYIKLLAQTSEAISAIVWIKQNTPMEKHSVEHEKFLIVEGSCDIMVNGEKNSLIPGDYFAIPLYADHEVLVTSDIPCKVVLQRVAIPS